MKEYTTTEMLEEIGRHPRKKFKYSNQMASQVELYHGTLVWSDSMCTVALHREIINAKWTEVIEPCDFMEAVKAFDEGQDIYCVYKEVSHYYKRGAGVGLIDQIDYPVDSAQILDGEWYIEDGEAQK